MDIYKYIHITYVYICKSWEHSMRKDTNDMILISYFTVKKILDNHLNIYIYIT